MGETHVRDGGGQISDAVLCDIVRQGEAWPLAVLWERHHQIALRWAMQKDATHAEDAVAEAFDAVYTALLGGGGPTESFRSYLFRTINTQFSRVWTREQRTLGFGGADEFDAPDVSAPALGETQAEREEQLAVAAALAELPERWQRVILEVDVAGRRVQEVAAELDLTPNSTTVLLKRARMGLKKSWLKHMHPPRDLNPECADCVAHFSEVRWGSRRSTARVRAEQHLAGCSACDARWRRFVEQASVIGMVSAGVLVTHHSWRRKAAVASVAALAVVGTAAVAVGVALPLLAPPQPLPIVSPLDPPTGAQAPEAGEEGAQAPTPSPGAAAPGETAAPPAGGSYLGGEQGANAGGNALPPIPGHPGGFEFSNEASVNVNDLEVGGGSPEQHTNTVWSRWGGAVALKVDAADHERGLAGARFKLWASAKAEGCRTDTDLVAVHDPQGGDYTVESGVGGAIVIPALWVGDDELADGTMHNGLTTRCYVLEEIAAPAQYVLPRGEQARTELIVRSDTPVGAELAVVIPNARAWQPQIALTGASGALLFAGGISLVLAGAAALWLGRARRRVLGIAAGKRAL